jgi:hypothetical protein
MPLPNTMIDMVLGSSITVLAIFAKIDPIEQTLNSYKNHEFIPPGRKTKFMC